MTTLPDLAFVDRVRDALDWWEARTAEPTSTITGSGAVAELERHIAAMCGRSWAVALPLATAALRCALRVSDLGPRAEVVVPEIDWPGGSGIVRSVGATPVTAGVDPGTGVLSAQGVAESLTVHTRAVIAVHLGGRQVDVHAIRAVAPNHIVIIEDCAQALGADHDGIPVGSRGDFAAFSFGPGKRIDAGEGGVLVVPDRASYLAAVRATQHPCRQKLAGVSPVNVDAACERIHPVAAIVALHQLLTSTVDRSTGT